MNGNGHRIGIRRSCALGDCILVTATIRALKQKYPQSHITVESAFFPQVFERNPDVDCIAPEPIKPDEVDILFDLDWSYERSPQKHIIDAYAEVCDIESLRELYLYPAIEDEKKAAANLTGQRIAVFHTEPASDWQGRNLPLDRYKFAADYLRQKGYSILEVGQLRQLESDIVVPQTTFSELCAYIEYADIFIGVDSASFHVAQAFKRPAVVPFGMIVPAYRILDAHLTKAVVAREVDCLGCHHKDVIPRQSATTCIRDKPYCMLNITDDDMKDAIDQALELVSVSKKGEI